MTKEQLDSSSIARLTMSKSLRKNFDSFLPNHKLRDAEEEYTNSIYRFREAEASGSNDYCAARVEMNRLEMKLLNMRQYIYTGNVDNLFELDETSNLIIGCPKPDWVVNISTG